MDKKNYLQYIAGQSDEGREVKSVLQNEMNLSARKIRTVKFNDAGILLDGVRVNVREKLHEGQVLLVLLDDDKEKEQTIIANPMELDIIYEDDNYLFVNKESGMVCHPAQGHLVDTLVNGVRAYFEGNCSNAKIHLVGRLDKDTSGIVAIAKNSVAAERLHFEKVYYAVVTGVPKPSKGYIDIAMEESFDGDDGRMLKMRKADSHGKPAGTFYEVINEYGEFSLCEIKLETGRTHQIRFHMSQMGWPLIGDPIYGKGSVKGMNRTALHAGEIRFIHPFDGREICLKAPLPKDMEMLLNN